MQGSLYRGITQPYSTHPVAVAAPPRRDGQPARLWNARATRPGSCWESWEKGAEARDLSGCPRRGWRWVQAGCLPRLPCRLRRLQLLPGPGVLTLEVSRGPLTCLSLSGGLRQTLSWACPAPSSLISLPEILPFRDLFMEACLGAGGGTSEIKTRAGGTWERPGGRRGDWPLLPPGGRLGPAGSWRGERGWLPAGSLCPVPAAGRRWCLQLALRVLGKQPRPGDYGVVLRWQHCTPQLLGGSSLEPPTVLALGQRVRPPYCPLSPHHPGIYP